MVGCRLKRGVGRQGSIRCNWHVFYAAMIVANPTWRLSTNTWYWPVKEVALCVPRESAERQSNMAAVKEHLVLTSEGSSPVRAKGERRAPVQHGGCQLTRGVDRVKEVALCVPRESAERQSNMAAVN